MYDLSKTALLLIPRVVPLGQRERLLAKFEAEARASGSNQIGANHVLTVLLRDREYEWLGKGLQHETGRKDVVRDAEAEWEYALTAECHCTPYEFEVPS